MSTRARIAKKTVSDDHKTVTFGFFDGANDDEGNPTISTTREVVVGNFPAAIRRRLTTHGASQLLGDVYSGSTKKGWDVARCIEAFDEKVEQLEAGQWAAAGGGPNIGTVVEAVVAARAEVGLESDESAIRAKLLDADARKAALANPAIKAHYDRINAERAAQRAAASAEAAQADGATGGTSLEDF